MKKLLLAATVPVLLSVLCDTLSGQDPAPQFDVRVETVRVDALVTTQTGKIVKGLKKEDFKIFEDGVEQAVTNFFEVDAPFSVGLILDTSYSTVGKLPAIQNAAIRFLERLHPDDEVMVISFDDEVYLDSEFTRNRRLTDRAIKSTRTGESTHLYDAVYLALEQMQTRSDRRVMVLFTDGVDTQSDDTSLKETVRFAKEANVLIYTIYFDTELDTLRAVRNGTYGPTGIPGGTPPTMPGGGVPTPWPGGNPLPIPTPQPRPHPQDRQEMERLEQEVRARYGRAKAYLEELAEATGGSRMMARGDVSDLDEAFQQIAEELRSLYSLSYVSTNTANDGKFRQIEVRPADRGHRVRCRNGYYSLRR